MKHKRLKTSHVISMLEDKIIPDGVNKISTSQSKGGFRFTLDGSPLSDEQRHFYEENGFIVIRGLVAPRELKLYKERFQNIASGDVKVPGLQLMKDVSLVGSDTSEHVITRIHELCLDNVLFSYCTLPQIMDYASSFCGPNLTALHSMLINKPPDTGSLTSRFPLHQDLYFIPIRPADRIVCSWTAMEKVTRENGCLVVIPGSHHGKILEHGYPDWKGGVNSWFHGVKSVPDWMFDRRVHLEMDAGDTVFFHPKLIHGSGANRTRGFRKIISCHYAASECEYINAEGSIGDPIAREVVEEFRRRFPNTFFKDYASVWKQWVRQVRGTKGNL